MLKYLLIALALVWLFHSPALRGLRGTLKGDRPTPRPPAPPPPTTPTQEAMVRCAHCGLHLPESDALSDGAGRVFCSPAHRQAGPRPA